MYGLKGRVTASAQSNLLGGYDKEETVYTFDGRPQKVTRTHTASGKATQTEVYDYNYDHAARLTKVEHTLNGSKVTLCSYTYDEVDRLQSKSPHGNASNKLTYSYNIRDYSYNIRDWVTGISGNKFSQALQYTDGTNPCYNGNISGITWKSGNESATRGYKLAYDGLNRLTSATYGEGTSISGNANRFTEKVTSYDKNGNIKALQRHGQTSASGYGMIDNLTFTLNGNQLSRVDDAVGTAEYNGGFEFKDAVQQANEYAYDANGNLTKDLNRNISEIQYNFLNLPSKVVFGDGSTIEYVYAADGTKLRTVHNIGGTTTTTDYCGNVVYENGTQKYLLTEEGYVTLSDKKYHYYLQDHQGNNRVVIASDGTVEEVNHYYPFGGVFASSSSVQPYKYNGKEFDTKNGVDWYDYGARMYDPSIGRFTTMDRFADKYYSMSPYQYGANNPVCNIEINGDSVRVYTETDSYGHSWLSVGEGDDMVVYSYGRFNGTYKGQKGINFANGLGNGDGVLLRMTGEKSKDYQSEKEELGMNAFTITDITDEDVSKILDAKFSSSSKLPNMPGRDYYNAPYAHIIDDYKLLGNNCTTFVSDILNQAGSKALEIINIGTNILGSHISISVKERYVSPAVLQWHLNRVSNTNSVVHKIK